MKKSIGEGGFAHVYQEKGKAFKYLKENLRTEESASHRFKREFEITKDLSKIDGIIAVYDYISNDNETYYTMELCDNDLLHEMREKRLEEDEKIQYINRILSIMSKVHDNSHIHRDLSPTNILIKDGELLISDFGLGKNIDKNYSYETVNTANVGQFHFVSPEQLELLQQATKQSDVYSLGKIINFILTQNPNSTAHLLMAVTQKATAHEPHYRHEDAKELAQDVLDTLEKMRKKTFEVDCLENIQKGIFNSDVSSYLLILDPLQHYNNIQKISLYNNALIKEIISNQANGLDLIKTLDESMSNCEFFESYDPYAYIAYEVLKSDDSNISYDIKMKAVEILNYVAGDINRFNAQDKISSLRLSVHENIANKLDSRF